MTFWLKLVTASFLDSSLWLRHLIIDFHEGYKFVIVFSARLINDCHGRTFVAQAGAVEMLDQDKHSTHYLVNIMLFIIGMWNKLLDQLHK